MRGGAAAEVLAADEFFATDEHQRALLAAFAVHRQLLPPSEADAREVREMNSGYRGAVAVAAAAAAAAAAQARQQREEERAAAAAAARARAELEGLMRKYLEVRKREKKVL